MPIDYTMDTIVDEVIDYSIILLDINGNVLTWNLGAKKLYGFSKNEILGSSWARLFMQHDVELPYSLLHIAKKIKRYAGIHLQKSSENKVMNVDLTINAAYDATGLRGYAIITKELES